MDNISIIIRNRNEGDNIGFAIQSCLDHFENPEIIIVDNNSTDDSLHVVNLFKDRAKIKAININNYSPGRSINLGAKAASNETVLVLSAHAQITSFNKEVLGRFFIAGYVAVFGNQTPIYRGKKITKRYVWSHFTRDITDNLYSDIEDRHFLHNAFCFYQKKFLLDNPMPEDYSSKEDRYWAADIVKKGHKYVYDGWNLRCNHFWTPNGATWKGLG